MSKELYMAAHEELIAERMEADPMLSWSDAYDYTADAAYDRMKENLADMADQLRQREKDGG